MKKAAKKLKLSKKTVSKLNVNQLSEVIGGVIPQKTEIGCWPEQD